MCGRFQFVPKSVSVFGEDWEIDGLEDQEGHEAPDDLLLPRFNIAPSQQVPVVLPTDGKRCLRGMRWGLVPGWAREGKAASGFINARVETAREKPSFRDAWRHRRCLVLSTGYYEWAAKGGPPTLLTSAEGIPFAFAGLWEAGQEASGKGGASCTILTTQAAPEIEDLHPRMPVMLRREQVDAWLHEGIPGFGLEETPRLSFPLATRLVSRRLNKVGKDGPEVLEMDPQDAPPPPGLFD